MIDPYRPDLPGEVVSVTVTPNVQYLSVMVKVGKNSQTRFYPISTLLGTFSSERTHQKWRYWQRLELERLNAYAR